MTNIPKGLEKSELPSHGVAQDVETRLGLTGTAVVTLLALGGTAYAEDDEHPNFNPLFSNEITILGGGTFSRTDDASISIGGNSFTDKFKYDSAVNSIDARLTHWFDNNTIGGFTPGIAGQLSYITRDGEFPAAGGETSFSEDEFRLGVGPIVRYDVTDKTSLHAGALAGWRWSDQDFSANVGGGQTLNLDGSDNGLAGEIFVGASHDITDRISVT